MRKTIIPVLALLGLVLFSQNLGAADCDGNGFVTYSNDEQFSQIADHAHTNCCAGSVVLLYNLNTDEFELLQVDEDGPNSSCML